MANIIYDYTVSTGSYNVTTGTVLSRAKVTGDGTLNVYEGGIIDSTTVSRSNANQYKGLYLFSGGTAVNTQILSGGCVYVYGQGSAMGGVVSSGGVLQIREFSYAQDLVVMPGATVTISSGATVKNLKDNGGSIYVLAGANVTYAANIIDKMNITADTYTVRSGTTLTNTTVGANGTLAVSFGGVTKSTTVNSCNNAQYRGMYVYSGGTALDTTIKNGGTMYFYGQASASGIEVQTGGACQVNAGAVIQDVKVRSGSYLNVYSGAKVYNILEDGGSVYIQDGAIVTFAERIISNTTINNGPTTIHDGTTLVNTVIAGTGKLNINAGGKAVSTTVNACNANGGLVVYSGGIASGNTMNRSGFAYIFSGGSVIDNTILSGGSMTIFTGAVMKNVDVRSGGLLYLSSGAVLTGRIRVATSGGYIFIDDVGTTINFDVSEIDPDGSQEVLLDDFERIRPEPKTATNHVPNYVLTVSDDQAIGTYKIAVARQRVEVPTITVKNTAGKTLGTLTEKGSFQVNGVQYRLSYTTVIDTSAQQGVATLFLHIGDDTNDKGPAQPVVSANIVQPTTSPVTVTATFDGSTTNKLYSFDATNWLNYTGGVTVSQNCRVYFRGENGNGASGISCYTVSNIEAVAVTFSVKGDIDGNGISEVMFQYTGGDYQLGFWMNGTNVWKGNGLPHPAEWEVLGAYDMNANGKADAVLVGNVVVGGVKGAYIGYYADSNDQDANWVNIGYLSNPNNYTWKNKVGNLTGNAGKNSIVWHNVELGALGAWTDGTDTWVGLGAGYDSKWTMIGCGDFNGDGKDSVVMSYNGGTNYYAVNLDGTASQIATSDSGWEVRAIGDFSGDGKDDIIAFHKDTGIVAKWADGSSSNWSQLGQLNALDWFVVGCGDYNNDQKDDLLVRQYSTGMLGYYSGGDMSKWNTLGYGVDMSWTVIA